MNTVDMKSAGTLVYSDTVTGTEVCHMIRHNQYTEADNTDS